MPVALLARQARPRAGTRLLEEDSRAREYSAAARCQCLPSGVAGGTFTQEVAAAARVVSTGSAERIQPFAVAPLWRGRHVTRVNNLRSSPSTKVLLPGSLRDQSGFTSTRRGAGSTSGHQIERHPIGSQIARPQLKGIGPPRCRALSPGASQAESRSGF